jgi:MFS family permease
MRTEPNSEIARVLLAFLATAGIFYVNIMPAIVDGLIEGLSFTNRQAGLVGSANLYGAAFGAFSAVFVVKTLPWRKAAYGLLVVLISMDLASILITNPTIMISARFVHGFVGGMLVGVGFAVMSRTTEVHRTFGYLITIQFGLGGLGIIYLPPLVPEFGTSALFLSLVAFSLVTMLMIPFLSEYPAREQSVVTDGKPRQLGYMGLALFATFLFQAANMAIYAFAIGIGKHAGLDSAFVSTSLGVAAWVAIAGSIFVILLSTRYGRLMPVTIAIVLTAVGIWALHYAHLNPDSWTSSVFWLSQALVGITWAFCISYLLGICSEFDTTGQMAALGGFASKMGLASGPAVAALIVGQDNYALVINVSVVALIVCALVFISPARVLDRKQAE